MPESDQAQAKTVILRVNKPARMGIDDASLYPCSLACRAACVRRCYEKQACYEIGCYENGTRGSLGQRWHSVGCVTCQVSPLSLLGPLDLTLGHFDLPPVFYGCVPRQTSRIPSLIAHADLAVFLRVESEGYIIGLE